MNSETKKSWSRMKAFIFSEHEFRCKYYEI